MKRARTTGLAPWVAPLGLALAAIGCGSRGAPPQAIPGTTARFDLAASAGFYELPFPNDVDRDADGTLDFRDFPVPEASPVALLLRRYGALPDPPPGSGPARVLARRGIAAFGKDGATNVNRADPVTGEGHYVLFQLDEGKRDYGCFLATLVRYGVATVPRAANQADAPCE